MIKPSEWQEIEKKLQGIFGSVKLKLGDDIIQLERRSVDEGRSEIIVFINGRINVGWGFPDNDNFNPLVKVLWRARTRSLYSPKERERIIKNCGKRGVKKYFPNLHTKHTCYVAGFPKAKTLVNQFKKLKELELVAPADTEDSELEI